MARPFELTLACILVLTWMFAAEAQAAEKKGRFYFEDRGEAIWEVPTGKKAIALTFDDGPDPVYTPQILDILKESHARATFFVVGKQAQKYPSVMLREVQEGHEVENHTNLHPDLRYRPKSVIQKEIRDADAVIASTIHHKTMFFRPPGGFYNQTVIDAAKSEGCMVVLWSWDEDSRDWANPGTGRIVRQVAMHADDGDIVLFHDHGGNRRQTVDALRVIVPALKQKGFQFVTVSELIRLRNMAAATGRLEGSGGSGPS